MQLLFWSTLGGAAAWYTAKIMLSEGRDRWMSVLVGIAAGVSGGFIFDATPFRWEGKMIYTSLVSDNGRRHPHHTLPVHCGAA